MPEDNVVEMPAAGAATERAERRRPMRVREISPDISENADSLGRPWEGRWRDWHNPSPRRETRLRPFLADLALVRGVDGPGPMNSRRHTQRACGPFGRVGFAFKMLTVHRMSKG